MRVVLLASEGYGGTAQIEVDGQPLLVRDALSEPGEPAAPGPIAAARFRAVAPVPASWPRAAERNPERLKKLEHVRGWRYLGFAEILGVNPVRADLGALVLELDLPAAGPELVGRHVVLDIDRITLVRS